MDENRCTQASKGQLSVFILIGLTILCAFSLMWYLNTRSAEIRMAAPSEKIVQDVLEVRAVPYHTTACMEKLSKEATVLVGLQGGDIYESQGGLIPEPSFVADFDGSLIAYGIGMPYLGSSMYPGVPGYPGGTGGFKQAPELNFDNRGNFGSLLIRKLCDAEGPNSYNATYVFESDDDSVRHVMCVPSALIYAEENSIQEQIEKYIESKIRGCVELATSVKEVMGDEISIGEPDIVFRLGTSDVSVEAKMPLTVKISGKEPVYLVEDYRTKIPVRLKMMVELATYLSIYDSYDLRFNLSKHANMYGISDNDIKVRVETPLKPDKWFDIVTIEDKISVIDGSTYTFRFARANRYPALDYIHQQTEFEDRYDIVVMENDRIIIKPNDPCS